MFKALDVLLCADVPLRNYSLTSLNLRASLNLRTRRTAYDFLFVSSVKVMVRVSFYF